MEPSKDPQLEQASHLLEAPKEKVPWWAWVAFVLLCLIVVYALIKGGDKKEEIKEIPNTLAEAVPSPFDNLDLEAKAVFVWDIANKQAIYAKNENEPLPLASLTKVMAVVVASDLIPSFTTITINKEFLNEEGDTGLFANEKWLFKDLSDFSLTVSSNDGMRAIASVAGSVLANTTGTNEFDTGRFAFIYKMNEKAKQLGLTQTRYENETGLDVSTEAGGAFGSAEDMAHLFEYALNNYPELLESTRKNSFEKTSLSNLKHVATNTNPYVHFIPGIIASKTGFTDISGGNLIIAFNPELGRPIVISVLGSSYEGRFIDTLKLIDSTMSLLARERANSELGVEN